jgi:AcrR family transcriptional regulator
MAMVSAQQAVAPAPAPAKRPKDRRARIALAAAELFCERGYHGVGIDEIAEAVGITGPAVYRHFPTKYAMLVHATRDLAAAALDATAGPASTDVEADLNSMLVALARLGVDRRRVGGLYQWEGRYLAEEHRAEFRADLSTLVARLAGPLRSLRPTLSGPQARLLGRAALSVIGSLSTHRAPLARGRAVEVLRGTTWVLLRADLPASARPVPAHTEPVPPTSRRETLMAEALRLFHRNGYHAVSMDEIGRAAGINASSVYRHFAGKADLLAAIYYRAAERVAAANKAALAAATDPDDALRRVVDSYVDLVFTQGDLVSVYQAENNNLPDRDRHELRKAQRLQVEEWVRLLAARRPELPTAEARVLVHAALNLVTDLARLSRFDRGRERVVADLAVTTLRRARG